MLPEGNFHRVHKRDIMRERDSANKTFCHAREKIV